MKNDTQVLRILRVVKESRRRAVWSVIVEYVGSEDGQVYRKRFIRKGARPFIPERGTHAELSGLAAVL